MTNYGSNIAGLRASLRKLPKEATDELKTAAQESAEVVARVARTKALGVGRGFEHLGPTIKAPRLKVPEIKIGGKRRIPGRTGENQTVGDLLFGTEFGGRGRTSTMQFLPHRGTAGYALWPAVRDESDETMQRYSLALLHALEDI